MERGRSSSQSAVVSLPRDTPSRGRGEVQVPDVLRLGVQLIVAMFGGFTREWARHGVGRQVVAYARPDVLLIVTQIHASVRLL